MRLGFIETPHLPADLVTAHLRDDEMLVVTAPGHPWARRRRPLSLAEIAATPLVMREAGSGTRVTLTDHLAAQHPPLSARIAMELGTSAAVRSAIAEGVGPGVLSRLAVRDDLVLGRLVAIEVAGPPLKRQLTAVWRPDLDPLPPEGARLLAVAKGAVRQLPRSPGMSPRRTAVHGAEDDPHDGAQHEDQQVNHCHRGGYGLSSLLSAMGHSSPSSRG